MNECAWATLDLVKTKITKVVFDKLRQLKLVTNSICAIDKIFNTLFYFFRYFELISISHTKINFIMNFETSCTTSFPNEFKWLYTHWFLQKLFCEFETSWKKISWFQQNFSLKELNVDSLLLKLLERANRISSFLQSMQDINEINDISFWDELLHNLCDVHAIEMNWEWLL